MTASYLNFDKSSNYYRLLRFQKSFFLCYLSLASLSPKAARGSVVMFPLGVCLLSESDVILSLAVPISSPLSSSSAKAPMA